MIIDLFNELQRPGPSDPATQSRVFADALEQAELADRLGYGCWWSVEHHCTPEFSHSGAPELMNVAIAMRTSRLRVGHAGVLTPFRINHPIRAAERAAVLDHLSCGRVEVGWPVRAVPSGPRSGSTATRRWPSSRKRPGSW
ncbi:MAG: LLM class flavin-dependent oxidoreductase [Acidimicrobiales bacterium]